MQLLLTELVGHRESSSATEIQRANSQLEEALRTEVTSESEGSKGCDKYEYSAGEILWFAEAIGI